MDDLLIDNMRRAIGDAFSNTDGALDGPDVQRVLNAISLELSEFAPEFAEYIPPIEPISNDDLSFLRAMEAR